MNINRLHYYCTLVQTGNMRKAAELLRLSPPALSKAIRVLEREVGFKLTIPSGRGILITDKGQQLALKAAKLVQEVRSLRDLDADVTSTENPLRLGSFEVFTTHFLGDMIEKHFSHLNISVHELVPGHLESALSSRQIDIGITYIPVPFPDLDHLKVTEIEMGIFGRSEFQSRSIDFLKLPFVVPVTPISGSPNRAKGLDGWPDDQHPRFAKYKVTLLETALELCRRGLAVAYLPAFVVRLHNRTVLEKFHLHAIHIHSGIQSQRQAVYVIKRKSAIEDDRIKKIAKALRITVGAN